MIKKTFAKNGKTCRVTFTIPAGHGAEEARVCGSFTDWMENSLPMKKRKDGRFSVSTTLKTGQTYHFRYLLDGTRWQNDEAADGYVPNSFGSEDSVLQL